MLCYVEFQSAWYAGCYQEAIGARDLAVAAPIPDSTQLTPLLCVGHCYALGFALAGLQQGQLCMCGDTVGANSVVASQDKCTLPCPGDASQVCGGTSASAVFKTSFYLPAPIIAAVNATVYTPTQLIAILPENATANATLEWSVGDELVKAATGTSVQYVFSRGGIIPVSVTVRNAIMSVTATEFVRVQGPVMATLTPTESNVTLYGSEVIDLTLSRGCLVYATLSDTADGSLLPTNITSAIISRPLSTLFPTPTDYVQGYPLADTLHMRVGPSWEGLISAPYNTSVSQAGVATSLPFFARSAGMIEAVEFEAASIGSLQFLVLRPSCTNGNHQYCSGSAMCQLPNSTCVPAYMQCSTSEIFCPFSGQCISQVLGCTQATLPAAPPSSSKILFNIIDIFNISVASPGKLPLSKLNCIALTELGEESCILNPLFFFNSRPA